MSASGAGTAASLTLAGAPSGTLTTFMKPASSSASLSISPIEPGTTLKKVGCWQYRHQTRLLQCQLVHLTCEVNKGVGSGREWGGVRQGVRLFAFCGSVTRSACVICNMGVSSFADDRGVAGSVTGNLSIAGLHDNARQDLAVQKCLQQKDSCFSLCMSMQHSGVCIT